VLLSTIREIVAAGLAAGLAVMWLFAGVTKLFSPLSLAYAQRLINGPRWLCIAIVRTLPFVEIALGGVLLTRHWVREAASISLALFVSFTLVLGIAYFRGSLTGLSTVGDCGCFGKKRPEAVPSRKIPIRTQLGPQADYIAARMVVRPLILAMISCVVAFKA
jgi:hypothetical protein